MNATILFNVSLDCGHKVLTDVELRLQYPKDVHFILCAECEELKLDAYGRIPTAWRQVVGTEQLNDPLHHVCFGDEIIMPNRIMRIQPSVPRNRIRPFPYVKRVL